MFQINWKLTGLWAFAKKSKQSKIARIGAITRHAQVEVLGEYASGRMTPSLADRFKPTAFAVYNLTKRTVKYRKRQLKILGAILPYYSPRRRNFARVAAATLKGKPLEIVRALAQVSGKPHLTSVIHKRGIGWNAVSRGKGNVVTKLTMPGAKILNRGGERTRAYRKEFLDLDRGGGRDSKAILAEIHKRTADRLGLDIDKTPATNLTTRST